jgi:phage major head subunit gpT-like protein
MITTGAHPKELWPGVKAFFGATYDEHPEEYGQIFDSESSDKAYEERVHHVGLGLAPVKDQGASISFEDTQQGYVSRITNVVYALGGIVTREAIEDGQYESIATRLARYMAFSVRQTQENVCANVLNRAFNSSYTGGDGLELCSAVHVTSDGTQSNELAVASDFSESALEDLLVQIMNATDTKGLKISLIGQKLIVPPALSFEAARVLESVNQSGTANNDINAIRALGMLPGGVAVNHYLTDTDAWFVKTNAPEGMIYQTRRAVEFAKDNDFDTENAKMKASIRFGVGWADWRGIYGSPGA